MQISSRFTIAVHILLCIYKFSSHYKVTSEFLAGSTNVNAVIVRKIMGQLQSSNLIMVTRGPGGAKLNKNIDDISLFDVYKCVDSVENALFHFHPTPNVQCPVGKNIHNALDSHLLNAQKALEDYLAGVYLSDLIEV